MRVAFISYEAPPDTLVGGIGTYVGQAARTLAARGHDVEVFAASPTRSGRRECDGYVTHHLRCPLTFEGHMAFRDLAATAFADRHAQKPFDVLEGPEFLAEAAPAKQRVPKVPLVIKLHMSMTLIRRINRPPLSPWKQVKEGIKRRIPANLQPQRWKEYDYAGMELPHILEADEISAPCREIADITAKMWNLDRAAMVEVPYPYVPSPQLLSIPVETNSGAVGFVGRLERRKGVIDLAQAIPAILERFPNTEFIFAGASEPSPSRGVPMKEYIEHLLPNHREHLTFLGRVEAPRMPEVFHRMDICVLPSLWENFPNACLEAMASGRGVVGSAAGGMAQQLDDGRAGQLVAPGRPDQIANAVCRFLADPPLRMEFGRTARARILSEYSSDKVGSLMEASYARAIRQHGLGGRKWLMS